MEGNFKLMLVDDEPWALIGLEEIIDWKAMGFDIVARCGCGQEALIWAREFHPDAVITDIRMPDMSGIQLYQKLYEINPEIVGTIVSAYADFEIAREAIRLALLDYVLKPLESRAVEKMAYTIHQKLVQNVKHKPLENILSIDPENPYFPVYPEKTGGCWLLLAESAEVFYSVRNELKILGEVQIGSYRGLLIHELSLELPLKIGISRPACDFLNAKQLFKEAQASLNGGFRFPYGTCSAKVSSAGDVQLYLYEHLAENISLKKLAAEFFLTETYLCDLFKKQTGESIFNFLKHVRLHRAKKMIERSEYEGESLTLKEISLMCGYQEYSYFGQLFKKETGMTPEAYRRSCSYVKIRHQAPE